VPRCASRSRIGRRRKTTSTVPPPRFSAPPASDRPVGSIAVDGAIDLAAELLDGALRRIDGVADLLARLVDLLAGFLAGSLLLARDERRGTERQGGQHRRDAAARGKRH